MSDVINRAIYKTLTQIAEIHGVLVTEIIVKWCSDEDDNCEIIDIKTSVDKSK